jgi:hypothetical protein
LLHLAAAADSLAFFGNSLRASQACGAPLGVVTPFR